LPVGDSTACHSEPVVPLADDFEPCGEFEAFEAFESSDAFDVVGADE